MRIIIVDDEYNAVRDLELSLREIVPTAEISTAAKADTALELFREREFDVAFLDVNMPVMDGLTLAKEMIALRPMVVLLMILYYVILGKSGLEAVWVAVIGFALNFGAYASEIMRSGIESIDSGQREAALALGYNENQAFFRFIFPQAAVRFIPVYKQEIVSLLLQAAKLLQHILR